jgi:hypothetical protein
MRPPARRAEHRLIRICFVIRRIVSNPALNIQVRIGAAVRKRRHAETLRASSDRRFDLTQIKARCGGPHRAPLRIAQLLIWVQTYRVEYRGIRYTIRARIEREQWSVAIHPAGVEMKGRVVIGSREQAELEARALINDWLKRHPTQKPNSS